MTPERFLLKVAGPLIAAAETAMQFFSPTPALAEGYINIADRGKVELPTGFYQRATLVRLCLDNFKDENSEFCQREPLLMIKSVRSLDAFELISFGNGEVTLQVLGEGDSEDLFDPIKDVLTS